LKAKVCTSCKACWNGRRPCASALPYLRYAEVALAECMRLYLPGGAVIPAGSKVFFCPYVTHRLPRYFPHPQQFHPQRFSDKAKSNRPNYASCPFGGGPRLCISQGLARMEGVLVLACILRRFRLEFVPGQHIMLAPGITLSPRRDIMMKVLQR
jgi:cytochrome P450